MHRFIGKFPISDNEFWVGDEELVHQVRDVLKLHVGEKIVLVGEAGSPRSEGAGKEAICELTGFDGDYLGVKVLENKENKSDPSVSVELYLSILKNENFDLAVQKAVEVGVSKIIPIIADHTVKTGLKMERLKKIMKEASEQSGRGTVPEISEAMDLKTAIKLSNQNDINIFFDFSGAPLSLKKNAKVKTIGVFIGPEGGWSEREVSAAKFAKLTICTLGKLVYRAETASTIAVYEAVKSLG